MFGGWWFQWPIGLIDSKTKNRETASMVLSCEDITVLKLCERYLDCVAEILTKLSMFISQPGRSPSINRLG